MTSLSDKLKSLGVKMGSSLPPPPKPASQSIDSVVAGSFLPNQLGEVFVSENVYGQDYFHGNSSPIFSPSFSFISQWAKDPRISSLPLSKFAFLDTETSQVVQVPMPF